MPVFGRALNFSLNGLPLSKTRMRQRRHGKGGWRSTAQTIYRVRMWICQSEYMYNDRCRIILMISVPVLVFRVRRPVRFRLLRNWGWIERPISLESWDRKLISKKVVQVSQEIRKLKRRVRVRRPSIIRWAHQWASGNSIPVKSGEKQVKIVKNISIPFYFLLRLSYMTIHFYGS